MLSNRWNQVKDPEAKESLRLIEQAINQLGNAIGIDPFPSQQNQVAQGGPPITAPQPPLGLSVTSVSGGVLVQITANPANNRPVNAILYFVETSTSASWTNVTPYNFGISQTGTLAVGTATLFYRCRCKYFNSGFSSYIPFGSPTAVTGGSASLGSTTGSGAVVLQTSPTIVSPTINEIFSLDLTTAGAGDTVSLLNRQDAGTAITGTGADVTLYTYTIPSGKVAAGKGIRVKCQYQHTTGSASTTIKLSLGGTVIGNYSTTANQTGSVVSRWSFMFWNLQGSTTANSYEDQEIIETNSLLFGPRQVATSLNMGSTQTVTFTFNVANTDQFTPMGFQVELIQ